MDYYSNFQKVIDYIEEHLTDEIDSKVLSQILGTNEQFLQVIFTFITNTSLAEYIKRRRFSCAYEELKNSNIKVLDLAIKYHYGSETSFTRAFKNYYNMTPSECRENNSEFTIFPVFQLPKKDKPEDYNFKIEEVNDIKIYAYRTKDAKTKQDLLFRIRELYQDLKDKGLFNIIVNEGMYAVTFKDNNEKEVYWVGCKKKLPGTEQIIISKGKYLVFDCKGARQQDVVSVITNIWSHFIKSSDFKLDDHCFFEKYKRNDNCFLYIKVIDESQ